MALTMVTGPISSVSHLYYLPEFPQTYQETKESSIIGSGENAQDFHLSDETTS